MQGQNPFMQPGKPARFGQPGTMPSGMPNPMSLSFGGPFQQPNFNFPPMQPPMAPHFQAAPPPGPTQMMGGAAPQMGGDPGGGQMMTPEQMLLGMASTGGWGGILGALANPNQQQPITKNPFPRIGI